MRWLSVAVVLLVFGFPIDAVGLPYGVDAYCMNTAGSAFMLSGGTYAKHYIYPKSQVALVPWSGPIPATPTSPAGDGGDHVNSIYAVTQSGIGVETGWFRRSYMPAGPQAFTVYFNPFTQVYTEHWLNVPLAEGTWTRFKLQKGALDTWAVLIEEQQVDAWYYTGITSSYARSAVERAKAVSNTLDDDRGSWTYITYQPYGTSGWSYWPNAKTYNSTDPPYRLYTTSLGASNHWMYVNLR